MNIVPFEARGHIFFKLKYITNKTPAGKCAGRGKEQDGTGRVAVSERKEKEKKNETSEKHHEHAERDLFHHGDADEDRKTSYLRRAEPETFGAIRTDGGAVPVLSPGKQTFCTSGWDDQSCAARNGAENI